MNSYSYVQIFISACNEPIDCLQAFGDCREGAIPCAFQDTFSFAAGVH